MLPPEMLSIYLRALAAVIFTMAVVGMSCAHRETCSTPLATWVITDFAISSASHTAPENGIVSFLLASNASGADYILSCSLVDSYCDIWYEPVVMDVNLLRETLVQVNISESWWDRSNQGSEDKLCQAHGGANIQLQCKHQDGVRSCTAIDAVYTINGASSS